MSTWFFSATQKFKISFNIFFLCGYFFSIFYALLIIIPLYFVVVSAFKNNSQVILTPLSLPTALDFKKFIQAQNSVNLLRATMVSTGVTFGTELLTLLLAFP